jgi:hypothetical protein
MKKKPFKINTLIIILFLFCSNCSYSVKNCKISPDLERIGESALENTENLTEAELRAAKMACTF